MMPIRNRPDASSFTYSVFYNLEFSPNAGNPAEGGFALTQASDGNFYGTTLTGGANTPHICSDGEGCGTVFKVTPSGTATVVYSFCSQPNCADGFSPAGGLVQGSDGNFYGVTTQGGANFDQCTSEGTFGCGTIFKVTPSGEMTTLYSFCSQSNCIDGETPGAGLVQGGDGNFYGVTLFGGTNAASCNKLNSWGCGTIFKITPFGTFTTLYDFCGQARCADGYDPSDGLIQGSDGSFYGTAGFGGTNLSGVLCVDVGCGTVFKITPTGNLLCIAFAV
jgi:uncharacterized repeat protein (TIGR03803 family)